MKFTLDANSKLAREIRNRVGADTGTDMTLSIVAHSSGYTDVERITTARLMSWTLRKVVCDCPTCPSREVLDVEWMDVATNLPVLPPMPKEQG